MHKFYDAITASRHTSLNDVCFQKPVNNKCGNHWKERPTGQANFICPSTGERQGQKGGWVDRGVGGGVGMGDFWDSIGNVNEENT